MTTQLPSYRTIGGATVVLAPNPTHELEEQTTATCGGCGDQHDGGYDPYRDRTVYLRRATAARNAKTWAQSHAEKCLALPRQALPDSVVARAKTTGGGHIDIRHSEPDGKYATATGTCSGCGAAQAERGATPDIALNNTKSWARGHASCPFIPGGAA